MTTMTLMTMNYRCSLNRVRHSAVESRARKMGREYGERKCDKVRRCSRPTRPLGASMAQHTSLHGDLDLLLAEGILPLPVLADEVGGARRAAHLVVPSLGSPPGSPLSAFEFTSAWEVSTSPLLLRSLWLLAHHLPQGSHRILKGSPLRDGRAMAGSRSKTRRENPL